MGCVNCVQARSKHDVVGFFWKGGDRLTRQQTKKWWGQFLQNLFHFSLIQEKKILILYVPGVINYFIYLPQKDVYRPIFTNSFAKNDALCMRETHFSRSGELGVPKDFFFGFDPKPFFGNFTMSI